jgi:hypothetical protein
MMAGKPTDYGTWSDKKLAAEEARLAEERTKVRLAQNAVAAEREIRAALSTLSPNALARLRVVRVGGEIGAEGGSSARGIEKP